MDTIVLKRDLIRLWRKVKVKPVYWFAFAIWLSFFSFTPVEMVGLETKSSFSVFASEQETPLDFTVTINKLLSDRRETFPSEITAQSILIRERTSGQILYTRNESQERSPASLTKMLTGLLVAENCDLTREVTISIVKSIGSIMGLENGERVTYEDLLYGMLVASGNDAAEILARDCFGSEEALVKKMNERISFLGLEHTHFEDVTGLTEDGHYASAFDLNIIAELVLRNDILAPIVDTQKISLISLDQDRWYNLETSNDLLGEYPEVYGVKTGFTEKAGECLVFVINHNGHDFLVSLLGSSDRFEDAKQIIDWIKNSY